MVGNPTDRFWGFRIVIIAFSYIIGLVFGIFVLLELYPSYGNAFLTVQVSGLIFVFLSVPLLRILELKVYTQTDLDPVS